MTTLALFGAGEFLPWARDVDRWCVETASAGGDRVLVAPTASAPEGDETFDRWARMGIEHYDALGLRPEVLDVRTRADAMDPAKARAVEGARLIYFSGGNPGYLAEALAGTPLWRAIADAAATGTALGGCSAGAMFLGVRAPFIGGEGVGRWVDGLALLQRAFVLAHFDALDSYRAGLQALMLDRCPPGCVAVGIDENTAMYGDGSSWTVTGSGAVTIRASDAVRYTAGDRFEVDLAS
jgi:cyanophycinase